MMAIRPTRLDRRVVLLDNAGVIGETTRGIVHFDLVAVVGQRLNAIAVAVAENAAANRAAVGIERH